VSPDALLDLFRSALTVTIAVSAPFLIAGLAVGLAVAVVQTATQLQESVLTFVPKLAAALLVLALAGHWALDKLGRFTTQAFTMQADPHDDLVDLGQAGLAPAQP
jgi:flagellar biosynthetic protein FliQ